MNSLNLKKLMPRHSNQGNYHHGDLRRAVIDSALQLITERDIQSLTLRAIAKRVGVSPMAPYRHFKNKAVLLAVLAQEGFQALYEHLQATSARSPSQPLAQLQALGVAYILYAVENPVHYRVMFDSSLSNRTIYPPLYQTAVQNFDSLVQTITKCQQAGLMKAGDPKELAQISWSMYHGLATLLIDNQFSTMGHAPVTDLANSALKTLIEGLKRTDCP